MDMFTEKFLDVLKLIYGAGRDAAGTGADAQLGGHHVCERDPKHAVDPDHLVLLVRSFSSG